MFAHLRGLPAVAALAAVTALATCAPEAESAADRGSSRIEPATELEAPASAAEVEPTGASPEAAVPPAEPSTATVATPARSTIPATATPRPPAASSERSAPVPAADRPPVTPARRAAFIEAGTSVAATIEEELSTDRNRVGDHFHARLVEDVLGANGEVLLGAGAVLNGRVTVSRESAGSDDPAVLGLEVESVTTDGRTLPLVAEVVEVEAAAQVRDSGARTAAKVGAGAAAGAIIGRILGSDRQDAVRGAVVGAAAGTAVAVATRDGQAVVKPGARMVVRLTERLVVER